jgi:hypothetical protein
MKYSKVSTSDGYRKAAGNKLDTIVLRTDVRSVQASNCIESATLKVGESPFQSTSITFWWKFHRLSSAMSRILSSDSRLPPVVCTTLFNEHQLFIRNLFFSVVDLQGSSTTTASVQAFVLAILWPPTCVQ